jgi:CHAD domain-containing protein
MAFQFDLGETAQQGARRLASVELDDILRELADDAVPLGTRAHSTRKRCKRLRGLLRMIRPGMPTAKQESDVLRDAARLLSQIRDAHSVLDAFNQAMSADEPPADALGMKLISSALIEVCQLHQNHPQARTVLKDCRHRIAAVRDRVDVWQIRDGRRTIRRGFRRTYARGRRAMNAALTSRSTGDLHQWRKRVKDLWIQLGLLENLWPAVMRPLAAEAKALADDLGDDHDLAILLERLQGLAVPNEGERAKPAIAAHIDLNRSRLQERALAAGVRLYSAQPAEVARQIDACWHTWRQSR